MRKFSIFLVLLAGMSLPILAQSSVSSEEMVTADTPAKASLPLQYFLENADAYRESWEGKVFEVVDVKVINTVVSGKGYAYRVYFGDIFGRIISTQFVGNPGAVRGQKCTVKGIVSFAEGRVELTDAVWIPVEY